MKLLLISTLLILTTYSQVMADTQTNQIPISKFRFGITQDNRLKDDPFLKKKSEPKVEKPFGTEQPLPLQPPVTPEPDKPFLRYALVLPNENYVSGILGQLGQVSNYNVAYSWLSDKHKGPSVSVELHIVRLRLLETTTFDIGPSYTMVTDGSTIYNLLGVGTTIMWEQAPAANQAIQSLPVLSLIPLNYSGLSLYLSFGVRPDDWQVYGFTIGVGGIAF